MFNKLGTKGLLIIILVLVGVWLISEYGVGDSKGTVRSVVVEVDTARLTGVIIQPRRFRGGQLEFTRLNGQWSLRDSMGSYVADKASIGAALSGFRSLRTLRLGGSMAKHAAKYELVDTLRSSITFRFSDADPITVHCGLVNMEAREAGETFVNVAGEDDIHVIEGSITRALDQPTSSWREHTLIGGDPANWRALQMRFDNGSGYELVRSGASWTINGDTADAGRVEQFLKSLSKGNSSRYADKAVIDGLPPVYSIRIEQMQGAPVIVEVFDTGTTLVLVKRDRPDLKFWLDRERDMSRLFRPAEYLLSKPAAQHDH